MTSFIEKGIIFFVSDHWQVILPTENHEQQYFFPVAFDPALKTGQIVQFSQTDGVINNITITKKKASTEILRRAIFVHNRNIFEISIVGFGSGADNICSSTCSVRKNEVPLFKKERKSVIDLFQKIKLGNTPITYVSKIKVYGIQFKLFSSLFSIDHSKYRVDYDLFGNKYIYLFDGLTFTQVTNISKYDEISNLEQLVRQDQVLSSARREELVLIEKKRIKAKLKKKQKFQAIIQKQKEVKKQKEKAKAKAKAAKIQAEKNYQDEMYLRRKEMERDMEFEMLSKKQANHLREQQLNSKKHRRNLNRMNAQARFKQQQREQKEREQTRQERRQQQQEYWRRQCEHERQRAAVSSSIYQGAYKGINPYHVLGIVYQEHRIITFKEIEQKYRRQFLRFHPDKHHGLQQTDPILFEKYTTISKMLCAAKTVLLSSEREIINVFLQNPGNWNGFNSKETALFNSI